MRCSQWQEETSEDEDEASGSEEENETEQGKECFYCRKTFKKLGEHVINKHKNAIRCEMQKCQTYFNTEEEREQHNEEVHLKSRDREIVSCLYCDKKYQSCSSYRVHVKEFHTNLPAKCTERGCLFYFKDADDLKSHLESVHREDLEKKIHECKLCLFRTAHKKLLKTHIKRKHQPTNDECLFCCVKCKKMFPSQTLLNEHANHAHKLSKCKYCQRDVATISRHMQKKMCIRCKDLFDCSGLLENHKKQCSIDLKCANCGKLFVKKSILNRHMNKTSKKCGETQVPAVHNDDEKEHGNDNHYV